VKEAGLIIDFFQSPIQEESTFKKVVNDLYIPLFKIIKSHKDWSVTLNLPLSTLDMLDRYGFGSFILEIKEMYANDRLEIVNSSPYGMPLSGISTEFMEAQIILNEYALGYYLGSKQGFEGEPSIMMRDLVGFLPPRYYFDTNLHDVLSELGYRWVSVSVDFDESVLNTFSKGTSGEVSSDTHLQGLVEVRTSERINDILFSPLQSGLAIKENITKGDDHVSRVGNIRSQIKSLTASLQQDKDSGVSVFKVGGFKQSQNNEVDCREIFNDLRLILEEMEKNGIVLKSVESVIKNRRKKSIVDIDMSNVSMKHKKSINRLSSKSNEDRVASVLSYMSDVLSTLHYDIDKDELSQIEMWNSEELTEIKNTKLKEYLSILNTFSKIGYILGTINDITRNKEITEESDEYEQLVYNVSEAKELFTHIDSNSINETLFDVFDALIKK